MSANDLQQAQAEEDRKRREYLRARRELGEALRVRSEAERLGGMIPRRGDGEKDWSQDLIDTKMKALKAKVTIDTLGNANNVNTNPQPKVTADLITVKGKIIQEMVQQGKDPDYIESAMSKISPYIDTLALANDNPAVQSILVSKIMSGNVNGNGTRDLIQLMQLARELHGPQQSQQSDPTSVMNAAGNLFRTGVETARGRNDGVDMSQVLAMQQQSHDKMLQAQQEHFRELRELQTGQPTLVDQVDQLGRLQSLLGKIGGKETEAVVTKRLELDEKKWEASLAADTERKKAVTQADMFKQITGGLGRIFESPIIKKVGENLGETLGRTSPTAAGVVRAVSRAPEQAANAELQTPPTHVKYQLSCQKCGKPHSFTALEISQISDRGGRWTCPTCGEVYQYQDPSGEGEGEHGGTVTR